MKKVLLVFVALLLCLSPGFAGAKEVVNTNQALYRIHFGTGLESNNPPLEEMEAFIVEKCSKLFPAGLTLVKGQGNWKLDNTGVGREVSFIVDGYTAPGMDMEKAIATVAKEYANTYKQHSAAVFLVRVPSVATTLFVSD